MPKNPFTGVTAVDVATGKVRDVPPADAQQLHEAVFGAERPPEPPNGTSVWYRGWEAGYEPDRAHWTGEGYTAYKGGCDLDARTATGATWDALLSNVNDEEDEV